MRQYDLSPLYRSTVGFDRLFSILDQMAGVDERAFLDYLRDFVPGVTVGHAGTRDVSVVLTGETKPTHFGTLDFVDVRLDQASGTMRARAVFPNKDGSLTPGLFGRVSIAGSETHEAILIPDEALASDQDRRIVFVVGPDNKVATRVVRPEGDTATSSPGDTRPPATVPA